MGSDIATGLANTFRYLPQHTIENVFGRFAPNVEGFFGMSPAPDAQQAIPVQHVDPADVQKANESFRKAAELSTMRKPLPKGK